jgi:hypothetical protein
MNTEVLKGTATGVRESIHVRGDSSSVSTSHRTMFKIGTTTVIFVSDGMPIIGEGDRLAVAGSRKGKQVLVAFAYVNLTAGVMGNAGWWSYFGGMLVGFLGGAGLLLAILLGYVSGGNSLDQFWRVFLGALGLACFGMGFYSMYRWLRIRAAVKALKAG